MRRVRVLAELLVLLVRLGQVSKSQVAWQLLVMVLMVFTKVEKDYQSKDLVLEI